jgi:hypothetical protein
VLDAAAAGDRDAVERERQRDREQGAERRRPRPPAGGRSGPHGRSCCHTAARACGAAIDSTNAAFKLAARAADGMIVPSLARPSRPPLTGRTLR